MEVIRRNNNIVKRRIIEDVGKSAYALDVGCGYGGDLIKWQRIKANVDMCDPNADSLKEAMSRAKSLNYRVNFIHGDILQCPHQKYDVICFNFSLHYIFKSFDLFKRSLDGIAARMKKGGHLIGCIPDSDAILMNTQSPFVDEFNNKFIRGNHTGFGGFGEKLWVYLSDTPYYAKGPIAEPIAYKDILITELEKRGIMKEKWVSFSGSKIEGMYSEFKFCMY